MQYFWCLIQLMCQGDILHGQFWVCVVVADDLAPIRRQNICNHHDVIGKSMCLRCLEGLGMSPSLMYYSLNSYSSDLMWVPYIETSTCGMVMKGLDCLPKLLSSLCKGWKSCGNFDDNRWKVRCEKQYRAYRIFIRYSYGFVVLCFVVVISIRGCFMLSI